MTQTVWPPTVTPGGMGRLAKGIHPSASYTSPDGSQKFHLLGGRAPVVGVQRGVHAKSIEGILPSWRMLDQQGARQDGVTNMGSVGDPIKIKMECVLSGREPGMTVVEQVALRRRLTRAWLDSWSPNAMGKYSWFTPTMGHWWGMARWAETDPGKVVNAVNASLPFTLNARIDSGLWQSYPSTCKFPATGTLSGSASGWLTLTNRGDQIGWPSFLAYGPFTQLSIANGPGSPTMITFGPALAGQVFLLNTLPRLPIVVDLSQVPGQATPQTLNQFQQILADLISFATNNNVPPLLQEFESMFGILPAQTNVDALLGGRFTNPIPAKPIGAAPVTSSIAISITGATSQTKVIGALTPFRRYPE
ncbi:hypothetical protein [Mycolicibacterium brisbanense]|uniref:Gp34 n=1 Tax=Mycolicibacterium brisbanense TaxID=146020 RepID=A0A100W6T7_9MYCO|nr:hypothetical protein [Mycolicibacterium brisbanense]GAS92693.1 Gp34 [Mycolicibacterium brisbanense]